MNRLDISRVKLLVDFCINHLWIERNRYEKQSYINFDHKMTLVIIKLSTTVIKMEFKSVFKSPTNTYIDLTEFVSTTLANCFNDVSNQVAEHMDKNPETKNNMYSEPVFEMLVDPIIEETAKKLHEKFGIIKETTQNAN